MKNGLGLAMLAITVLIIATTIALVSVYFNGTHVKEDIAAQTTTAVVQCLSDVLKVLVGSACSILATFAVGEKKEIVPPVPKVVEDH